MTSRKRTQTLAPTSQCAGVVFVHGQSTSMFLQDQVPMPRAPHLKHISPFMFHRGYCSTPATNPQSPQKMTRTADQPSASRFDFAPVPRASKLKSAAAALRTASKVACVVTSVFFKSVITNLDFRNSRIAPLPHKWIQALRRNESLPLMWCSQCCLLSSYEHLNIWHGNANVWVSRSTIWR